MRWLLWALLGVACSREPVTVATTGDLAEENAALKERISQLENELATAKQTVADRESTIRALESQAALQAAVSGLVTPSQVAAVPSETASETEPSTNLDTSSRITDPTIRDFCEKKWPTDFGMQEYCMKEQAKAAETLRRGNIYDIPGPIFDGVRQRCDDKWKTDYGMRVYCEKQEAEAYKRIR